MSRSNRGKKPNAGDALFPSIISTELCRIKLRSPTMIASGILGISFELFPRIIANGCGAIVSKSIGKIPREGYKNPTMTGVDSGYLNAIGLANPGVEVFANELEENQGSVPLIVSIFAGSPEEFASLAKRLDEFQFLAYELNLSCPHVKDVGSEIGSDPSTAAEIVKQVKHITQKPVFAKMPAIIPNVQEWGRSVEKAGADSIVAINTVRSMKIDVETRRPILSNKIGGLSGPAIRPVGVRSIYELYEAVRIPLIGVGGICDWKGAVEYILAGATAVQIGSAMAMTFLETFGEINRGIAKYLIRHNYSGIKELVGSAHT